MAENQEELGLFLPNDFRDPGYYSRDLMFASSGLPELEWLTDIPPYDTWHDDGVPFLAKDWKEVMSSLTGAQEVDQITPKLAEGLFERYMSSGQYGRANTLAHGMRQLSLADEEHWSSYELLAGLAYIQLGLAEATLLPFATVDEETGEVVSDSRMEPKHFLGIYNMAMSMAQKHPEELAPYLEYADSLHMEMLLTYPYIHEYTHDIWKFWGSDPEHPQKQSIYERVKSRDKPWREQAADTFKLHIKALMRQAEYGRVGVLTNFARATELVEADFVRAEFLRVYDQLDLSVELPDHVRAVNAMFVPAQYPKLTDLKRMVSELWQNDPNLRDDLEAIMAGREIETIQTILSQPQAAVSDMEALLRDEMAQLARDLPDTDAQKKSILGRDTNEKIESAVQNVARTGATTIDRLIERHFTNLADGIVDMDALAVDIDRIEAAIIADVAGNNITEDTFERLIGYISPFCRLGQNFVEQYISTDFIRAVFVVIDARIEHYKDDEESASYYRQMQEKLEQGPMDLFKFYWDRHEEYYS